MGITAYCEGNQANIANLVNGTSRRLVVVVSDSTWTLNSQNIYNRFFRTSKVSGIWYGPASFSPLPAFCTSLAWKQRGDSGALLATTLNYSPTGQAVEMVFNGTTVAASANITSNRCSSSSLAHQVSASGAASPTDMNCLTWQGNFLKNAMAAGKTVKFRIWYLAHPGGVPEDCMYMQVRGGATTLTSLGNTSATPFNGYAATTEVRSHTLSVSGWTFNATVGLAVELRAVDGSTPTAGTSLILLGCQVTTEEADGIEFMAIAKGGESILHSSSGTWINTDNMDTGWARLGEMGFNHAVCALGINGLGSYTADLEADYALLATRIRTGIGANAPVLYCSQLPQSTTATQEALNARIRAIALADANGTYVDLYTAVGARDLLYQTSTSAWISGNLYRRGAVVLDGSTGYACIVSSTVGTTTPSADATNWVSLGGAILAGGKTVSELNVGLGDGTHTNDRGAGIYASAFWDIIDAAAQVYAANAANAATLEAVKASLKNRTTVTFGASSVTGTMPVNMRPHYRRKAKR